MYEGNDSNPPRTISESYASAISNGSTRVGTDPDLHTSGEVIAAAGMNRFRMGLALNRLLTEWNAGATPPPAEAPTAKELKRQGVDPSLVDAERRRRAAECTRWNMQENMLRFQRLKTLGQVRTGLVFYAKEKGYEDAEHLVAAVLRHFLSPVCPACEGRKRHVIAGTGHLGKRDCSECRGTGVAKVPYGGRGERLLDHIKVCTGKAASDLREGAQRLHRGGGNVEDRAGIKAQDEAEKLRRADAEAKADAAADTQAVAAHFRDSMVARRPKG